jgi:hypothetical protein
MLLFACAAGRLPRLGRRHTRGDRTGQTRKRARARETPCFARKARARRRRHRLAPCLGGCCANRSTNRCVNWSWDNGPHSRCEGSGGGTTPPPERGVNAFVAPASTTSFRLLKTHGVKAASPTARPSNAPRIRSRSRRLGTGTTYGRERGRRRRLRRPRPSARRLGAVRPTGTAPPRRAHAASARARAAEPSKVDTSCAAHRPGPRLDAHDENVAASSTRMWTTPWPPWCHPYSSMLMPAQPVASPRSASLPAPILERTARSIIACSLRAQWTLQSWSELGRASTPSIA